MESITESINPYVQMVVDSEMKIAKCDNSIKRLLKYDSNEVVNNKTELIFSYKEANGITNKRKAILILDDALGLIGEQFLLGGR